MSSFFQAPYHLAPNGLDKSLKKYGSSISSRWAERENSNVAVWGAVIYILKIIVCVTTAFPSPCKKAPFFGFFEQRHPLQFPCQPHVYCESSIKLLDSYWNFRYTPKITKFTFPLIYATKIVPKSISHMEEPQIIN